MSTAEPIETRDMAIVHRGFRSAYDESARLVRANPTPSEQRVQFLCDHIDFGAAMLHHHHASEDELLYPLLIERVPDQAPHTEEIEHEHQTVAGSIDAVSAACAAWRQQQTLETAEALAASLTGLNDRLQQHLDDEERDIVPLAAVTLTQDEWDAIGQHSIAQIPRDKMGIAFGSLTESLDDADREYMKKHLPLPVRLLYPVLIEHPWRKYATTLRTGT